MKEPTESVKQQAKGRNLRNHSIYWGQWGFRVRHPQRQRDTCRVEAREADFKEMNLLTNEAENGSVKDRDCEIAIGLDSLQVIADFSDNNFA